MAEHDEINRLIKALKVKTWKVRRKTLETLKKIGSPAVEPLLLVLRDLDAEIRSAAVYALGKFGEPRAVDPLIMVLRHPISDNPWKDDLEDRWEAVKALIQVGAPAVEPLLPVLRDPDARVRSAAVDALGKIGDPRVVEPLLPVLRDPDANVRIVVVNALAEIGDPRAVEPLLTALRDPDANVRIQVVYRLGKLGDSRAVDPLHQTLQDEEETVRKAARGALTKLQAIEHDE